MRSITATLLLLVALTGCSSGDDDLVAVDPATPTSATPTVPVPSGAVRTTGLVTVLDTGAGPEVCLGAVADSSPPQCTGPAVLGWSWADHMHEEAGGARFGSFALTGTWDGTALTVADAVPAALYDVIAPQQPPTLPTPTRSLSLDGLAEVADEASSLPGAVGAAPDDAGHVLVDVAYDDGTIQSYADQAWGAGVVVVTAVLVDVG